MADTSTVRHKVITADHVIYEFSKHNEPCQKATLGETVIFETLDCFGGQIREENDTFDKVGWDKINPATGPLFIEGANPGDTLAVQILDISVNSPGIMVAVPEMGALGHRIKKSATYLVPIKNGLAHMPTGLILETQPMVGVIGVAPEHGSIPCGTPGPHGGNMDTKIISKGSTVYLPVNVPGALLALGDLHALMGDGEILVCGIEVSGKVTVSTHLIKNYTLPCPVVETDQAFYTIWSEETLDKATEKLLDLTVNLLSQATGWSLEEATLMLSARGNLEISQVVDPLKTVRMEIPKCFLKGKHLLV